MTVQFTVGWTLLISVAAAAVVTILGNLLANGLERRWSINTPKRAWLSVALFLVALTIMVIVDNGPLPPNASTTPIAEPRSVSLDAGSSAIISGDIDAPGGIVAGRDVVVEAAKTPTKIPTPLPLPSPERNQFTVLISDFEQLGSGERAIHAVIQDYLHEITDLIEEHLPERREFLVLFAGTSSSEEAKEIGEAAGADIVVWGTYDDSSVRPHYEVVTDTVEAYLFRAWVLDQGGSRAFICPSENVFENEMRVGFCEDVPCWYPYKLGREHLCWNYQPIEGEKARMDQDQRQAVNDLSKAIELDPSNAFLYFFRARAYASVGEFKLAQESFAEYSQIEVDEEKLEKRRTILQPILDLDLGDEPSPAEPTSLPQPGEVSTPAPTRTPMLSPTPIATNTPTPNPTATPVPIPTPSAVVSSSSCTNEPVGEFRDLWSRYQNRLGCPIQTEPLTGDFVEQPFEGGHMFWFALIDQAFITIGHDQGDWMLYQEHWDEDGPLESCSVEVPAGKVQPIRGFGWIWCRDQEIRDGLGWALDIERGFPSGIDLIQGFESGIIFLDSDGRTTGKAYIMFGSDKGTFVREQY